MDAHTYHAVWQLHVACWGGGTIKMGGHARCVPHDLARIHKALLCWTNPAHWSGESCNTQPLTPAVDLFFQGSLGHASGKVCLETQAVNVMNTSSQPPVSTLKFSMELETPTGLTSISCGGHDNLFKTFSGMFFASISSLPFSSFQRRCWTS